MIGSRHRSTAAARHVCRTVAAHWPSPDRTRSSWHCAPSTLRYRSASSWSGSLARVSLLMQASYPLDSRYESPHAALCATGLTILQHKPKVDSSGLIQSHHICPFTRRWVRAEPMRSRTNATSRMKIVLWSVPPWINSRPKGS